MNKQCVCGRELGIIMVCYGGPPLERPACIECEMEVDRCKCEPVYMRIPARVFYRFEEYLAGETRFKWELCYLTDKCKWNPNLYRWNPKAGPRGHWQFAPFTCDGPKDIIKIFQTNRLQSVEVLAGDPKGVGLDYDDPIFRKVC